jgi:putative membrane protein
MDAEMKDSTPGNAASPRDIGTTLAFERTRIAYERTMMAWLRTATSFIAFGFAVYKFFQIELQTRPTIPMLIGPRAFGMILICMGLLLLLLGAVEHGRDMRALRKLYVEMPRSASSVTAIVFGALGLLALVAVIVRA